MKLTRPLIFLDIESATANPTSPDPQHDRIIELAAMKFFGINTDKPWHDAPILRGQMFNPGIPINKECSEIHGFTDDTVKDCRKFEGEAAKGWHEFIGTADLAGFGIWFYDLPLLIAEFERAGLNLCWRSRLIVDASLIFKKKEERTLTAAAKFYCGLEHTDAHGAAPDVMMSVEVFKAQLERYPDVAALPLPELHNFCQFDQRLTLDGAIVKGPDGDPVYTHKKVKGVKVKDDLGYARWMLYKADFPRDTREWLEGYITSITAPQHDQDDMFVR